MKASTRILSLILALVMLFALSVSALAKTSSDPISAPADADPVFTVKAGAGSVTYTWADVNGKGEFASATHEYSAKVDGVQTTQSWTGVALTDLLADAEKKLNVEFRADYRIAAAAADGFLASFTVEDAMNAENLYLVAPDPVNNYDDDTVYDNSYVRILRYGTSATSNQTNIRCITGIEVLDEAGKPLTGVGKVQGGDVMNSVFYIAVKESADSEFKFYYYTREDLEAYDDTHDFKYVDHTVPKTVTGRGASIKRLLDDISDAVITDDMIVQYAESDGYHADADTPIEESAYKDKVAWLTASHVTAGGDTVPAVETVACYQSKTVYDDPDENNVNSVDWEDADAGSGYLRAYRQRDDANSAVIKTLMGVVVSYSGSEFSGNDGYTLNAVTDKGYDIEMIEPSTGKTYVSQSVTGLVPGMQYAVNAPAVNNASISVGQPSKQVVTAAEGTSAAVTFQYTEATYLNLNGNAYTFIQIKNHENATQVPSQEEVDFHGTPYGYYDAMYYRYNGAWLCDLIEGDAVVRSADGESITIPELETGDYFLAYGYTASKSSTNVSEGKRFTYAYESPKLLLPHEGTLVGEAEAGAEGNKRVPVAMDSVVSITRSVNNPFTDVKEDDYFYAPVLWAVEKGITNGKSDTSFVPNESCTRAQMVTFLWRAMGKPAPHTDVNPFTDVKQGDYFYDAVLWAVDAGVTRGTSETAFSPDSTVTRGQAVTFLYRLSGMKSDVPNPFTDLKEDAYYYDAVLWAAHSNVTNGVTPSTFAPDSAVTRGQAVTFLSRVFNH